MYGNPGFGNMGGYSGANYGGGMGMNPMMNQGQMGMGGMPHMGGMGGIPPMGGYGMNQGGYNQPMMPQSGYNQNQFCAGPFNVDADCNALHSAMHGIGTNDSAIINICLQRDFNQRTAIRNRYPSLYGKDLIERLKSDLSGNYEDTICGLFMTPIEFDAHCLYKAMKGSGTNEDVLFDIIGTRNPMELQQIKQVFQQKYQKPLENWVSSETSGTTKKLLLAILQCNRSMNTTPDMNNCTMLAQRLYNAGEGRWGTDESTFIQIFANCSFVELGCIDQIYNQNSGSNLEKAINEEFSGNSKKLLLTLVKFMKDPA